MSLFFSVFNDSLRNIPGKTAAEQNRVDIRVYDFMLILWDFAIPKIILSHPNGCKI